MVVATRMRANVHSHVVTLVRSYFNETSADCAISKRCHRATIKLRSIGVTETRRALMHCIGRGLSTRRGLLQHRRCLRRPPTVMQLGFNFTVLQTKLNLFDLWWIL